MNHDASPNRLRAATPLPSDRTVIDLATRRRHDNVLDSITLVFGGINYGTISIGAPYTKGKPIVLYLVPAQGEIDTGEAELRGPLEGLITDDVSLAFDEAR